MSEALTVTTATTPMSLIQAAIDKGISIDNLGKLMDLQERWEKNEAAKTFGEAIAAFQAEMPPVVKANPVLDKSGNKMYSFASFDDIMAIAQPILNKFGIVITFSTKVTPEKLLETTCQVRVGIHREDTTITLALPAIPNANDAQKAGAALAYGKRYSMIAALNIQVKGEDNDATDLGEKLNEQQIQRIDNLIERRLGYPIPHASADKYVAALLKWADAPGGKVCDIPVKRYEEVVKELEKQIAKGTQK